MSAPSAVDRALLACGIVAGPLYVTATLAQALTRNGFDLRQHRFSALTAGDLGWLHQTNMALVGVLTMLFAVGIARRQQLGRAAHWGPRILVLFGAAYLLGGLLTADPTAGFPPDAITAMSEPSWQGNVQSLSRSASTLLLLVASVVFAVGFAAHGRPRAMWVCIALVPCAFAALCVAGLAIGGNPTALAWLASPWIWLTWFAVDARRSSPHEMKTATALG